MKAMKQLLIVIGLVSVITLNAQTFAEHPSATMRSTSVMQGVSSTLPQAAISGTHTTYDSNSPYNSTISSRGPKKGAADDDDTPPVDPNGPMENPIGDAILPMMLLAVVYGIYLRRKKCVRIPDSGHQQ